MRIGALGVAWAGPGPASPAIGTTIAATLRLAGSHAYDEATLRRAIEDVHATTVEAAQGAVDAFYLAHGYLAEESKVGGALAGERPLLSISEGAIYTVSAIEFAEIGAGAKKGRLGDATQVKKLFTVHAGDRFDRAEMMATTHAIEDRYDQAGYGLPRVQPVTKLDVDAHTVRVLIELERNLVYKIGAIDVTDAGAASPDAIRQLVAMRVGEIFHGKRQREAEARLKASGHKHARIDVESIDATRDPATVRVTIFVDPPQ